MLAIFEVFNINITGLSLPLSCMGLGTYRSQLLFTMLFPIAIAAGIVGTSLIYAVLRRSCATYAPSTEQSVSKIRMEVDASKSTIRVARLLALPHLLTLSFLVFPMVSSRAVSNSVLHLLLSTA